MSDEQIYDENELEDAGISEEMDLEEGFEDDASFSDDDAYNEDDYEEINSEEVDRVVAAIEELSESVESENIRAFLVEAANSVYSLVYDDSEGDEISNAAA
ncbi:MAG: hypothetical protein CMJ78_22850 [Planctomycetaceae bacterium]|nr:hypothetical protein [Planctomycetaceae bacterium]